MIATVGPSSAGSSATVPPLSAASGFSPAPQPQTVSQQGFAQVHRPTQVIHHAVSPRVIQGQGAYQVQASTHQQFQQQPQQPPQSLQSWQQRQQQPPPLPLPPEVQKQQQQQQQPPQPSAQPALPQQNVVRQLARPSSYTALPVGAGVGAAQSAMSRPGFVPTAAVVSAGMPGQTAPMQLASAVGHVYSQTGAAPTMGIAAGFSTSAAPAGVASAPGSPQPQVISYTAASAYQPVVAHTAAGAMHLAQPIANAVPVMPFGGAEGGASSVTESPSRAGLAAGVGASLVSAGGGGSEPASPRSASAAGEEWDEAELDWVLWTPEDVGHWADELLGAGFGDPFRRHKIDGPTLLGLSESELRDPLGFKDPLHVAKLMGHFRTFQVRRARLAKKRTSNRRSAMDSARGVPPRMPGAGGAAAEQEARAKRGAKKIPGDSHQQRVGASPSMGTRGQRSATMSAGAAHSEVPTAVGSSGPGSASMLSVGSSQAGGGGSVGVPGHQHFSTSSHYSRHLSTSKSEQGLLSNFGVESPSTSARGSFAQADRQQGRLNQGAESPGPAAYDFLQSEASHNKHSYKATIGSSPRRTSPAEKSVGSNADLGLAEPGPQSYDAVAGAEAASLRSPRAVFGSSTRESSWHGSHLTDEMRRSPGPASYNADPNKTRTSSPHATMGKSSRNTLEYIASQEPAVAAATASRNSGKQSSPRVRGGVIGTGPRHQRGAEAEAPGPCYYEVDRAIFDKSAHQPSARIGGSPRNTCEFLVRNSSRSALPGSRGRNGRCGSGSPSRGAGPGPMTYSPKPTALSTFR